MTITALASDRVLETEMKVQSGRNRRGVMAYRSRTWTVKQTLEWLRENEAKIKAALADSDAAYRDDFSRLGVSGAGVDEDG